MNLVPGMNQKGNLVIRSAVRIAMALLLLLLVGALFYVLWPTGRDLPDGRHDRGRNGIWIAHG